MSTPIRERQERRLIILEGTSQGLKHSEIATQLGVNKWVILNDLRFMRKNGDPELKEAQEVQEQIRVNRPSVASINSERFLNMTGMTFQEKSFRNMIDFNKQRLMKILNSKNQHAAIMRLPKSIRRTLKNNGIITNGWQKHEITLITLDYLLG
jgi:DNA-binding CsgD family transcriptional regulator